MFNLSNHKSGVNNTAHNSGFSQLRILLKPVVDFPLENLILAESTQFRTSQLTRSGGTLPLSFPEVINRRKNLILKKEIEYPQKEN